MDLPIFSYVLIGLGLLVALAGGIILLISAFRQSIVWGLIVLLLPPGGLVYTCVHWSSARVGFLINLVGTILLFGGLFTVPELRAAVLQGKFTPAAVVKSKAATPAPDLSAQIAEKRKLVEDLQIAFTNYGLDLQTQYQALEKRRQGLKTADQPGVVKFNEDAAAYQAKNKRHKEMQQEIATAQKELDQLIDDRSRAAAAARTAPANTAPPK